MADPHVPLTDTVAAGRWFPAGRMSECGERVVAVLLLVVGVQNWLLLGQGNWGQWPQVQALGLAICAWLVPPVRRVVWGAIEAARHPSRDARRWTALALLLGSVAYLYGVALWQGRDFVPRWHDEFSYLIQMQMLARGRLWMPAHPLSDFFDTFYLIDTPVYASHYSHGLALMWVPGLWLHLPTWVMPLLTAGAVTAMLYLVMTELVDGAAGLLAAVLLNMLGMFRTLSIMVMAETPVMLLGLLALWGWLQWRRGPRARYAILMGLAGGWAAITRPMDGVILMAPIGLAVVAGLGQLSAARRALTIALILAGALPLLLLQGAADIGVTGHWYTLPWITYARRDTPQLTLGFPRYDPSAQPRSALPQKQALYRTVIAPAVQAHTVRSLPEVWVKHRLPLLLAVTLPHPFMLALLPVGVLALFRRGRWVLGCGLPLFVIFYGLYALLLRHHPIVVAPAVLGILLGGVQELVDLGGARRAGVGALLSLSLLALAVSNQPNRHELTFDANPQSDLLSAVEAQLAQLSSPSVVLFTFGPEGLPEQEPVYNADVAWPDDAPVIRAHDLGIRNRELFAYYARLQPRRAIYRFDEGDRRLIYLGTAEELSRANPATHSAPP